MLSQRFSRLVALLTNLLEVLEGFTTARLGSHTRGSGLLLYMIRCIGGLYYSLSEGLRKRMGTVAEFDWRYRKALPLVA